MYVVNFSPLKLVEYADVRAFDERVGRWMTIREAENCYMLGNLPELVAKAAANGGRIRDRLFAVQEGQTVLGAAIQFEGGSLCVTWLSQEMIDVLVVGLFNAGCPPAPVFGPGYVSWHVAQRWAQWLGGRYEIERAERVYQLERVAYTPPEAGRLERATVKDLAILSQWMAGWIKETDFEGRQWTPEQLAAGLVEAQRLYVWKCPGMVAMAAWAMPTPHGVSINYVYVPPELRGNGHGKNVTAALGKHLLSNGRRFCVILADTQDRRNNQIYQSIGARTLGELVKCAVLPKAAALR